jgi:hypothetical protein
VLRHLLAVVALAVLATAAPAQSPTHKIEYTDKQTVNATITYEIKATNFVVTRWIAFLPEPPVLPSQPRVKTTSRPAGKVVTEKSPLARPVRKIEVPVARPEPGSILTLRLDVEATLRSRRLVPLEPGEKPPAVKALTSAEKKNYLAAGGRTDFEAPAFREWLDAKKLQLGKGESPVDYAARVLAVLRADYEYSYDRHADRRASVVCGRAATDCGGLSCLFVAAMRANGVPARVLVGRNTEPRKPGSMPADVEYDRPHARVEFYLAGVGWVPVDPTYANRDRRKSVAEFVGYDPADLLVLHVETDLELPFPDQVRTADLLQLSAPFWADGRGKFDAAFGPSGWEVKTAPPKKK